MNDEGLADAEAANPFRLPRLHPGIGFAGVATVTDAVVWAAPPRRRVYTDAASQYHQPRLAIALSERCREPAGGAKAAAGGIGHLVIGIGLVVEEALLLPNSRHSFQGGQEGRR
jgi:hypothetical protein